MKGYIFTLIGVALIVGIAEMLSPDGERDGLRSHIRLISALCVLSVTLSPILSVIGALTDGEIDIAGAFDKDYTDTAMLEAVYNESLLLAGEENASQALEALICRELALNEGLIDVRITLDEKEESFVPSGVSVILYDGGFAIDPHAVTEYVESLLSCECEIIYR